MAVVEELIRMENNDTLSFGNYKLDSKSKLDNFAFGGDLYKVKTFKEITKLERNGMFVYESVPGTTVNQLMVTDSKVAFQLEEQTEYKVLVDNVDAGQMKTNLGGKLSLSVELNEDTPVSVTIEKIG